MGRVFTQDHVGLLTSVDATHVLLPASIVTVGGQQYVSPNLFLNASVSGVPGGLDTGALANNTLYWVYGVVVSGQFNIVASTNSVLPSGYTFASRRLGWFTTNGSAQISNVWPFNTRVAFRASTTSPTPDPWGNSSTQQITIPFGGNADYDTNLSYVGATGYTIPAGYGGLWEFKASLEGAGALNAQWQMDIFIQVNGTSINGYQTWAWASFTNPLQAMTTLQWNCVPGDIISVAALINSTFGWQHNDAYNYFEGRILTEVKL